METKGSTGSAFELPSDDSADGYKKSTHLELQELYGGDKVTVSKTPISIAVDLQLKSVSSPNIIAMDS